MHTTIRSAFAAAVLSLGLASVSPSQTPSPTWVRFATATVKPDHIAEFETHIKQLAEAQRKSGAPLFAVMQNFSGNRYEFTVVTYVMKFAEMDGPNPMQKAMGPVAFGNMVDVLNHTQDSLHFTFALPWDEVKIDKPGANGEYFLRTTTPVAAGKGNDFRAFVKNEMKPVLEKGGVQWFRALRPVFGGPGGTVTTIRMLKNLAEIDGGPVIRRVLGPEGAAAFEMKERALTAGPTEYQILRVRRDLSWIPSSAPAK